MRFFPYPRVVAPVAAAWLLLLQQAVAFLPHTKIRTATTTVPNYSLSIPPTTRNRGSQSSVLLRTASDSLASSEVEFDVGPDLVRIPVKVDPSKYKELCEYVRLWSQQFEDKKASGLTTRAKVVESHGEEFGMEIQFQHVSPAFKSHKEEREEEEWGGVGSENKAEKPKAPPKEGGVEIFVEKSDPLLVGARRCHMDENTFIKEMSEEHIVHELKKSIRYWSKENA